MPLKNQLVLLMQFAILCNAFSVKVKKLCWDQTTKKLGESEDWVYDYSGGIIHKDYNRCEGLFCYNYVHLNPWKDELGYDDLKNCAVVQTAVARVLRKNSKNGIEASR